MNPVPAPGTIRIPATDAARAITDEAVVRKVSVGPSSQVGTPPTGRADPAGTLASIPNGASNHVGRTLVLTEAQYLRALEGITDAIRECARALDHDHGATRIERRLTKTAQAIRDLVSHQPAFQSLGEGALRGIGSALARFINAADRYRVSQGEVEGVSRVQGNVLRAIEDIVEPTRSRAPKGSSVVAFSTRFVPIVEAESMARRALEALKVAASERKGVGDALSKDAEVSLYRALMALDPISGCMGAIASLDSNLFAFLGEGYEHLRRAVTVDHHGADFDPAQPEVNTSIKLLQEIKRAHESGDPEAIHALQYRYGAVTTDNLADAVTAIYIVECIPELVRDGVIRLDGGLKGELSIDDLMGMARFEDFSIFGSTGLLAGRSDLGVRERNHAVLANLHVFDDLSKKYGLVGSDRFNMLAPGPQAELVAEALGAIRRNFEHEPTRRGNYEAFKADVATMKAKIGDSVEGMKARLVTAGIPREDVDLLSQHVLPFTQVDGPTFATWDAPPMYIAGERGAGRAMPSITWSVIPKGEAGKGFILSVQHGEGDIVKQKLGASMSQVFGPAVTAAYAARGPVAPVARGDTLLFLFQPGPLSEVDLAKVLIQSLKDRPLVSKPL